MATELIIQQNVNTINSFECMNFHARNKKMHIEIKIQQHKLKFLMAVTLTQTSALRGIQFSRNLLPCRDLMLPWKYQVAPKRR